MSIRGVAIFLFAMCTLVWASRSPVRNSWTTPHFELAAPSSMQAEVPRLAAICEMVYDSLSQFYGYELPRNDRFRLVFLDEEDYSNGFAIGFAGWVAVYVAPGDFTLRGSPGWHANVLAHEISHLVSLRKLGFTSSYLGHMMGAGVLREHGSVTASMSSIPFDQESWLVEGLAQLGAEACGLDRWDAVRDALEREAYFSGDLPPLLALKTFHQDSRRAELLYNQGYSFMRWLRQNLSASDWKNMMNRASSNSLQSAIEETTQRNFQELFASWRKDRALRHELVQQQTQANTIDQKQHKFYGIQQKQVQTRDGIWQLNSDANDHGVLRLYDPEGDLVDADPTGFLWASRNGERLLFGVNHIGMSNVHTNLLKEIRAGTDKVTTIPGSERVYSACVAQDTLWVIRHRAGRNRLGFLENGVVTEVLGMPNSLEPLEISCDEMNGIKVVSATHGTGRALYQIQANHEWLRIAGEGTQDARNPDVHGDTLDYSSDETGSFQIHRIYLSDKKERSFLLTRERGGAFMPHWNGKSLEYSAFREGSFYIDTIRSLQAFESELTAPPELPIVPPISYLTPTKLKTSVSAADRMSFLGWYTGTSAQFGLPDEADTNARTGNVWSWNAQTGFVFADAALQNMIELQVGAVGVQNSSAYADRPGYLMGMGWTTQSFSPDLSLQAQLIAIPLAPHGGSVIPDSVQDELSNTPWITLLSLQGILLEPLTNRFDLIGQLQYQGMGIQDSKATEGQTVTIMEQMMGLGMISWQAVEPGQRHMNSGITCLAGAGFQWMGVVPLYTGISLTMPMVVAQTTLYQNLFRAIYGNISLDATGLNVPYRSYIQADDGPSAGWHPEVGASASLDFRLPWVLSGVHLGPRVSHAWTNMELHLEYGVRWMDSLLAGGGSTVSNMSNSQARPLQYLPDTRERILVDPISTAGRVLQYTGASLRWETLTFGNQRAMWELGVQAPPQRIKDYTIFVGLSF